MCQRVVDCSSLVAEEVGVLEDVHIRRLPLLRRQKYLLVHQVMLTHTELSIAVRYQFSNTDIFLYRYGPSRPRSPIDP